MFRTALALILASSLVFAQEDSPPRQLTISSGEWVPYVSQHLPGGGILAQIVSAAFATEKITVTYQYYPWSRSLMLAQTGAVAGTLPWQHTLERGNYFLYSTTLTYERPVIISFQPAINQELKSLDDLKGMTVGTIRGYSYGTDFERAAKAGLFKTSQTNSEEQNLRKLLEGRIDAVIADEEVIANIINRLLSPDEISSLKIHNNLMPPAALSLLISLKIDNAENILMRFNRGLAAIKKNGSYQKLINDYDHPLEQPLATMSD